MGALRVECYDRVDTEGRAWVLAWPVIHPTCAGKRMSDFRHATRARALHASCAGAPKTEHEEGQIEMTSQGRGTAVTCIRFWNNRSTYEMSVMHISEIVGLYILVPEYIDHV